MAAAVAVESPYYPRASGYTASSSDERCADTASAYAHVRPKMIRPESDHILSYYQSEYAGRSDPTYSVLDDHDEDGGQLSGLKRSKSPASTKSSSEYSAESLDRHEAAASADSGTSPQPAQHSQHTRRPSVPSQESVDRRRLAIVEVDHSLPPSISRKGSLRLKSPSHETGTSPSSALLSRRGIHVNGLALVAPPDASPSTYTDLTPPPTAPLIVGDRSGGLQASAAGHHHSRSASEAVGAWTNLNRRPSRDVGIVGTGSVREMADTPTSVVERQTYQNRPHGDAKGLQVPIFQTPAKSRSPSPATHTPELYSDTTSSFGDSLQAAPADATDKDGREQARTPAIGEEKDIQQPVVGPVIVGLDCSQVIRTSTPSARSGVASPTSQYDSSSRSGSPYQPAARHTASRPLSPSRNSPVDLGKVQSNEPPPRPPRKLRTPALITSPTPPPVQPKRDLDALKDALQLPKSVSVVLASRSSPRLEKVQYDSDVSKPRVGEESDIDASLGTSASGTKRTMSVHRREGAFPPSDSSATPETSPPIDLSEPDNGGIGVIMSSPRTFISDTISMEPVVIQEDSSRDRLPGWKLHRENSWISLRHEANRASSPNGKPHISPDRRSLSSSPSPLLVPLPPPKTGRGSGGDEAWSPSVSSSGSNPFKATLNNLKRFSALPRTPSQISLRSAKRASTDHSSRTPSPPRISSPQMVSQRRIVNAWPDAMQYRDVLALRSPSERSAAYAQKIKEFTLYESGLKDWIIATQAKKPAANRLPRYSPAVQSGIVPSPALLNPGEIAPIPRHVSGGSVGSEATFPIRPDAYQAADLSMRPDDDLSSTKSPPSYLPYPSLAASPSRSAHVLSPNTRTYHVPLSSGPSRSGTGFFASIGRKASLKKERGYASSPPSSSRVLTKRQPDVNNATPHPIHLNHSPSIPGGPRAAPGRMNRSRTISVAPAPAPAEATQQQPAGLARSETHRSSFSARRASLFHRSTVNATVQPAVKASSPEFERQVDKLADLLPHADRQVLAGYLRRAGQDVLAIGQYLEDEKNGTLRHD